MAGVGEGSHPIHFSGLCHFHGLILMNDWNDDMLFSTKRPAPVAAMTGACFGGTSWIHMLTGTLRVPNRDAKASGTLLKGSLWFSIALLSGMW